MAGVRPVLAGLALSLGVFSTQHASAVTIFTDQAAFSAALGSYSTDNFADFAAGDYFETAATRPTFSASAQGGLYNNPGSLSTNTSGSAILVDSFTGANAASINAVGGYFYATDMDFGFLSSTMSFSLNGLDIYSHDILDSSTFLGFISADPFESF